MFVLNEAWFLRLSGSIEICACPKRCPSCDSYKPTSSSPLRWNTRNRVTTHPVYARPCPSRFRLFWCREPEWRLKAHLCVARAHERDDNRVRRLRKQYFDHPRDDGSNSGTAKRQPYALHNIIMYQIYTIDINRMKCARRMYVARNRERYLLSAFVK